MNYLVKVQTKIANIGKSPINMFLSLQALNGLEGAKKKLP